MSYFFKLTGLFHLVADNRNCDISSDNSCGRRFISLLQWKMRHIFVRDQSWSGKSHLIWRTRVDVPHQWWRTIVFSCSSSSSHETEEIWLIFISIRNCLILSSHRSSIFGLFIARMSTRASVWAWLGRPCFSQKWGSVCFFVQNGCRYFYFRLESQVQGILEQVACWMIVIRREVFVAYPPAEGDYGFCQVWMNNHHLWLRRSL